MGALNKVLNIFLYPVRLLVVFLIIVYKKVISPVLPNSCKYTPSCSSFMLIAIKKHGLIGGFLLGVKRIVKCGPHSKGGLDPVPENIKGDVKWLI